MKTPIGHSQRPRGQRAILHFALALIVIAVDFVLAWLLYPYWVRGILAVGAFAYLATWGRFDREAMGLRIAPIQSVRYWIRATIAVGIAILIPLLAFAAIANSLDWEMTIYRISPDQAVSRFVEMCLVAPVIEELLYRLVLCVPSVEALGSSGCIFASGAIFAALHFVYGNPSPDNFLAGYVLAWAYLKSGSIAVPIIWHSLGNSVAFTVQLAAWYLL